MSCSAMTPDGRTLDHGTLETIRKMAVVREGEGERPSNLIAGSRRHGSRLAVHGA